MHILIVTDESDKEKFFGPFNNGDEALNWGEQNFNEDYFLAAVPLISPEST